MNGPYNTGTGLGDKGREAGRAAAAGAASTAEARRLQALNIIGAAGVSGMTADECAAVMSLTVLSVRPRISELVKMGAVVQAPHPNNPDRAVRRPSSTGRSATVWVTPAAAARLRRPSG